MKWVIIIGVALAIAALVFPVVQLFLALIGGFCIGVGVGWHFAQP